MQALIEQTRFVSAASWQNHATPKGIFIHHFMSPDDGGSGRRTHVSRLRSSVRPPQTSHFPAPAAEPTPYRTARSRETMRFRLRPFDGNVSIPPSLHSPGRGQSHETFAARCVDADGHRRRQCGIDGFRAAKRMWSRGPAGTGRTMAGQLPRPLWRFRGRRFPRAWTWTWTWRSRRWRLALCQPKTASA